MALWVGSSGAGRGRVVVGGLSDLTRTHVHPSKSPFLPLFLTFPG